MKVERIEPKIQTFRLTMEPTDEEYGQCMWAKFILDFDAWRLTINSDAGDYTYGWGNNDKHDNFTSLMARVNEGYLLNKMSSRSEFFIDKSKAEIIETIELDGWEYYGIKSEEQWQEIRQEILDIDGCYSEEMYFLEVNKIVPEIDFESIRLVKDYPHGAYVAIDLFIKYIQPIMKEEWKKIKEQNVS